MKTEIENTTTAGVVPATLQQAADVSSRTPAPFPKLPLALPPVRLLISKAVMDLVYYNSWNDRDKTQVPTGRFEQALEMIRCAEDYDQRFYQGSWKQVFSLAADYDSHWPECVERVREFRKCGVSVGPGDSLQWAYQRLANCAVEWIASTAAARKHAAAHSRHRQSINRKLVSEGRHPIDWRASDRAEKKRRAAA
ncbi:hypothetical protein OpiT1DRAFT_05274 [Opitutaceae bacterium TAV1]|nr:hypothetical protein OpiT1DRAFT_05274 [Opitutaceae bacterium TAV1]